MSARLSLHFTAIENNLTRRMLMDLPLDRTASKQSDETERLQAEQNQDEPEC